MNTSLTLFYLIKSARLLLITLNKTTVCLLMGYLLSANIFLFISIVTIIILTHPFKNQSARQSHEIEMNWLDVAAMFILSLLWVYAFILGAGIGAGNNFNYENFIPLVVGPIQIVGLYLLNPRTRHKDQHHARF